MKTVNEHYRLAVRNNKISSKEADIIVNYLKQNIHTFALNNEDENEIKSDVEKQYDKQFELDKDMYSAAYGNIMNLCNKLDQTTPGSDEENKVLMQFNAINIPGVTDVADVKPTPIEKEDPLVDSTEDLSFPLTPYTDTINTDEYKKEKSKLILESLAQSSPHLSEQQRKQVHNMLVGVMDCISIKGENMKITNAALHEINTGDSEPFREKLRPHTEYNDKVIDREIEKMLKAGVIKPSTSPYATNLLVVSKPDPSEPTGVKDRVCVAYVKLNNQTIKDTYPLPLIQQIFYKVCKSRWFTVMDLMSGFWQVAVKPEHRHKTAFITSRGLYEFMVMPFGLCNAPSTFQRLMDRVIKPEFRQFVQTYIDDVVIHSNTFEEHLIQVEKILQLFIQHKLTIKLSKCKFFQQQVKFLGHLISHNSLSINPAIIEVVKKWTKPITTNKKQYVKAIRSFLGTVGWFRKFIPHFSDLAKPLYDLTKINAELVWTELHQHAFEQLRDAIINAPVLLAPDSSKDYLLHTDASLYAIGSILLQQDDTGAHRPVAYYSRTLSPAQRNYHATDREALALVESCEHFKQLIQGHKYVACTDHNALTYIYKNQDSTPRLTRYFLRLTPFELTVQYKKGKDNLAADLLSRHTELMVSNNAYSIATRAGNAKKQKVEAKTSNNNDNQQADEYGEYEVERIVNRRRIAGSKDRYEYLIKWKNWPSSANTWEKLEALEHAVDMVAAYNRNVNDALDSIKLKIDLPVSPATPTPSSGKDEIADDADDDNITPSSSTKVPFPTVENSAATEYICDKCNTHFHDKTHYNIHQLRVHDANITYKQVINEVMSMDVPAMRALQKNDSELGFIFKYLSDPTTYTKCSKVEKTILNTHEFVIDSDDLLYCIDNANIRSLSPHRTHLRLVLPTTERKKFISYVHSNILSGHAGITHTFDKLRTYVWFPSMMKQVMHVLNQCPVCKRAKHGPTTHPSQPVMIPKYPWQMLSIDIVGPLPATSNGNSFIVTLVDMYSKYFESAAVKDITTATVADVVMELIICRYGLPEIMVSDQGSQFTSVVATTLYKSLGIRRITTTAYHPQANMVERYNRTLKTTLRLWANENQTNWDILLPYARFAYNTEYHSIIKETPYFVNHGRDARTAVDVILGISNQHATSVHDYVNTINDRLRLVHERIKVIYNKINQDRVNELIREGKQVKYNIGDLVYMYDPTSTPGLSKKLTKRWLGPYKITRSKSTTDYELLVDGHSKVVHINRLQLASEFVDAHTDIDIYAQTLQTAQAELQQIEDSIKSLVNERTSKQQQVSTIQNNIENVANDITTYANDDTNDCDELLDYIHYHVPHTYLVANKLKWRVKAATTTTASNITALPSSNTTSTTEVLVNNKKNWSFRKRQPSTAIITDLVPGSYHWILAKHKSTGTGVATNKTTTNIELTAIAICTTAIAHLV